MTEINTPTAPLSYHNGSQTFVAKRFMDCFRFYLATHRREMLSCALGLLLTPTLAYLLLLWTGVDIYNYAKEYAEPGTDLMWNREMQTFLFIIILGAAAMGSNMFADLSDKRRLIRMLEVPASTFEKFLVRLIIALPCFVVVMMLGSILGDAIRVLIVKCFTPFGEYARLMPLDYLLTMGLINDFDYSSRTVLTAVYMAIPVAGSIFALGATLFRKHTFIKTGASLFALNMVLGYIVYASVNIFLDGSCNLNGGESNQFSWLFPFTVGLIVSVLTYWLAYIRLKETEIVNRW